MHTTQAEIHDLERGLDFLGAAKLLVSNKFYQIGRSSGHLARFPEGLNGQESMLKVWRTDFKFFADRMPWPIHRSMPFSGPKGEAASGRHYLNYYAPAYDRIYVQPMTMDSYRMLGGGPFPNKRIAGATQQTLDAACSFCGSAANPVWYGGTECESCRMTMTRLDRFISSDKGREHVLRLIGKIGVHEAVLIAQGAHDARAEEGVEGSLEEDEEQAAGD